jgi:hydrogenase maturation protease
MQLVVCIGNELVADDAIGFEVHSRLVEVLSADVSLEYCSVGGISLLDLLDGRQKTLIIVDAMSLGKPVGTVQIMEVNDIPESSGNAISAHGIGLEQTLQIGRALYPERMPDRTFLVGIEGRCFDQMRAHMSPEVAAAVKPAVDAVLSLLQGDGVQMIDRLHYYDEN